MRIARRLEELPEGRRAVALGTFDGVHLGHRQAAGFSSDASVEEITDFVRREFAASGRSGA